MRVLALCIVVFGVAYRFVSSVVKGEIEALWYMIEVFALGYFLKNLVI